MTQITEPSYILFFDSEGFLVEASRSNILIRPHGMYVRMSFQINDLGDEESRFFRIKRIMPDDGSLKVFLGDEFIPDF